MRCVRDQNNRLVRQVALDAVVEDVARDLGVHGAEGVVEEVNVPVTVHGTTQVDPLLLATAVNRSVYLPFFLSLSIHLLYLFFIK